MVTFCNGIRAAVPSSLRLGYDLCKEEIQIGSIFEDFCQKYKVQLLIVVAHEKKKRDILLYRASDHIEELTVHQIVNALLQHEEIKISLTPDFDKIVERAIHLNQGNVAFSRKKLLPVILGALDN